MKEYVLLTNFQELLSSMYHFMSYAIDVFRLNNHFFRGPFQKDQT